MRIWVAVVVGSFALSCAERCSASNCDGCCTAAGECLTGNSNLACGAGGESCSACAFGQACFASACVSTSPSGGSGGTTGGGAGSTGGGVATGGGSGGGTNGLPSGSWVKQFAPAPGEGWSSIGGLAFDSTGHLYAAETKVVPCDLFSGCLVSGTVLAKYDSSGTEAWSQQIDYSAASGVAVDLDAVYVFGGRFLTSHASFLTRFDAQGGVVWTRENTTPRASSVDRAFFDSSHNVWALGATSLDVSNPTPVRYLSTYAADGSPQDAWAFDGGSWGGFEPNGRMFVIDRHTVFQLHLDAGVDWSFAVQSPDGGTAYVESVTPGAAGQSFVSDFFETSDGGVSGRLYELGASGNLVRTLPLGALRGRLAFDAVENRLWVFGSKDADIFVTSFVAGVQQAQVQFGTAEWDSPLAIAVSASQVCIGGITDGAFEGFQNPDGGSYAVLACMPR